MAEFKLKNDECEVIEITVPMRLTWNPERNENFIHMAFADCSARVTIDDAPVGDVTGVIGGGVEINIRRDDGKKYGYFIDPISLFSAAMEAHNKRNLQPATDKAVQNG